MPFAFDFSRIPPVISSILFVCTGNICRSPAAEAFLKSLVPGELNISIISAGTHAKDGFSATENMVAVCLENGINLKKHTARRLTAEMIAEADLIFAMERSHLEDILSVNVRAVEKTAYLGSFSDSGLFIADPYGCNLEEYRVCFEQIRESITNLYELISGRFVHKNH